MKICIPVSSQDGLFSTLESIPTNSQYIQLHDLETQTFEEIDLSASPTGGTSSSEFEAVICASIHRQVFAALRQQGKQVYLTEAPTVGQALEEFKRGDMFMIADDAAKGCGGGCHGHGSDGHAHGDDGCQCSSESEEGHCHSGEGECGGHGEEGHVCGCSAKQHSARPMRKPRGDTLRRFAVTSQNRKTITEHAGKCRKFWIYETQGESVISKNLLELPIEQSLHSSAPGEAHPLDDIDVLITGSIGDGLRQRLENLGIDTIVTTEADPDCVVQRVLAAN